jgi:CheY-like chemotaxis protein
MARLLLIEDDRSAVHAMEAALRGAGHRVVVTASLTGVERAVGPGRAQAVVLNAILRGASGFELLAKLRETPAAQPLPVLLVTTLAEPADRVRALQAGADDLLLSPYEPDELVARVHRLLASADRRPAELEGVLGRVSLPELLQLLESGGSSGTLEVLGDLCHGWIQVERGAPIRARFGDLVGREAVLAMLDLDSGRFRYAPGAPTEPGTVAREDMSIPNLMFTAAWLADERSRRPQVSRDSLVRRTERSSDRLEIPEGYEAVPLARIARCLDERPMVAVRELEDQVRSAPGMVQLAVAMLVEQGLASTHRAVAPPTDDDLLTAIRAVVGAVRSVRPDRPVVEVLLLADQKVFGSVLELRQRVPRRLLLAPGDSLAAAWRGGRVATLPIGDGPDTVIVHVASSEGSEPANGARLGGYDGVVLWTADGSTPARLPKVIEAVEGGRGCGVVLVPDRASAFRAVATLNGHRRWSAAEIAPESLAPILQAVARALTSSADEVSRWPEAVVPPEPVASLA